MTILAKIVYTSLKFAISSTAVDIISKMYLLPLIYKFHKMEKKEKK